MFSHKNEISMMTHTFLSIFYCTLPPPPTTHTPPPPPAPPLPPPPPKNKPYFASSSVALFCKVHNMEEID